MQSNNAMKQRAQSERRTVDGEGMYQLVQQCRGAKVGLLGYVKHRFRLLPGVGPPSDKDGPTAVCGHRPLRIRTSEVLPEPFGPATKRFWSRRT